MIIAYHRPQTLDEALTLLSRPNTFPLGGGTLLSHSKADSVEVIDLQALGLNSLRKAATTWRSVQLRRFNSCLKMQIIPRH